MPELELFDCNSFIGQVSVPRFYPRRVTPSVLRSEFDRIGVGGGLVTHVAAREYSPAVGNDLLREELPEDPSLTPCLTLLPTGTGELWSAEDLLDELRQRGARAVRLFPSATIHRYPLDRRVIGDLLGVLETARIPVFVDFDLGRRDEADWRALYDLAETFPELPLVVVRPGGRSDRGMYPFLKKYPNTHIETGGYWVHHGLERICHTFGPERLLFGSGFPYWSLSGAAYHVATSGVSPEEKQLIGSGNLRRLLGGART